MDIEKYKATALAILNPIKPVDNNTQAKKDFLFTAARSKASRDLKEYYLIYFLFADLIKFENLGRFEKIAWSFPIDYNGKAFLVEYRKFGVGVFVQDETEDEKDAIIIVQKINGAIKSARPFFDYLAEQSIKGSGLNILNYNEILYERYLYLKDSYISTVRKIRDKEYETFLESHKLTLHAKGLFLSYVEAFLVGLNTYLFILRLSEEILLMEMSYLN